MTLSAVATRYANALAEVVTAPGSPLRPEDAVPELRAFEQTLTGSRELREVLSTPAVPPARKRAVVERIAAILKLSRITRNFLFVLMDHRRVEVLPEIVQKLEETVDERLGFARADVTAPRELSAAQSAALNAELNRLTGKRIRMRLATDASLLGGAVARIGSTVYDGSVRGELLSLKRRLAAEG
ncbi:MAG TPA: ATP synthase F1 subunit delta [Bryobacteraceae bacterium]|nr:ATP synthase F1 subunit delta [Bryobacteraceae bacterium]